MIKKPSLRACYSPPARQRFREKPFRVSLDFHHRVVPEAAGGLSSTDTDERIQNTEAIGIHRTVGHHAVEPVIAAGVFLTRTHLAVLVRADA
ncbi:hypothetical protein GCM10022267_38140 [Lentzea roselyniae]|uniref:Uncharacterized protein n=1 Tax=Lentzea roselyniae TaxID=531940 RepID=A0ABP7B567_9PSEU